MIIYIKNRKVIIRGIGKLFYQDGLPLSISIESCKKQGLEVSLIHIADELIKNGWSSKTIKNKFRDELDRTYDLTEVIKFIDVKE